MLLFQKIHPPLTNMKFSPFFSFTCRLCSKWNYHWALANGDTSKGEASDFQRVTLEEAEKNKPKIKFKIVPPPPPQPKSKAPPRPPRRASPQPLIVRRKVEVDVFRLHWKESWKSLKPPKYLLLKANEAKNKIQGFTTIEVVRDDKYKPVQCASLPECMSTLDWRRSWKQVNGGNCFGVCFFSKLVCL